MAAIVIMVRLRLRHIFFHAIVISHMLIQGFHFFGGEKSIVNWFAV
jgi:hypothetical protein